MADISIITSLYRTEQHLQSYINHVLRVAQQLDLSLQVVVVANDATEFERSLLDNFAQRDELLVTLVYCERETLYASWNRGLSQAQAEFNCIWNVDDIRTVDGFKTGFDILSSGYDIVDFTFRFVGDTVKVYSAEYDPNNLAPKTTLSPFWMFRRSIYDAAGEFNSHFRIVGDFEWSKRQAVRDCKFVKSDVIAGDFIAHGENLSGAHNPLEWVEFNIALIWHDAEGHLRPVDPTLMREKWDEWGYLGADISSNTANWLWGDGAQERYDSYMQERNQPQWIRRIRLALARRNLLSSTEWDVHHKRNTAQ